jgi:hypothetical protein
MLEVINITRGSNNEYRWSYSKESKPMFKAFFHSFANNFDKSLCPLSGPCVVPTKGCWFGSESESQELELSVLLQTKQLVNTSFYSMELQNVQFVKLGFLLVVKILRKQRDATHMKF